MAAFSHDELERLERAGGLILAAEARQPILGSTAWGPELTEAFFASGCKTPPAPSYPVFDPAPSLEALQQARALIVGSSPVHQWLKRLAVTTERAALLLSSMGTAEFFGHSCALYGDPSRPVADGRATALGLAERLDAVLDEFDHNALTDEPAPTLSAERLRRHLQRELPKHFGAAAPEVLVAPHLSAKAVAGRETIKLRADALFNDLDLTSLLHHEALVHIATGLNGRAQALFPILGESHPGNTRTQEGLAVFAEFMAGAMGPSRLRRLSGRVKAIQKAAEGADFLDLFAFFQERGESETEAFESARRIVRGGLVSGGAPFTKDAVYLQGLLEVHTYLRTVVRRGEPRWIRLLFAGKADLGDMDALAMLDDEGLLTEPHFMPPWARDQRFLVSYLAYSTFLNQIDLARPDPRLTPSG